MFVCVCVRERERERERGGERGREGERVCVCVYLHLQMNRVTEKIDATKHATEKNFMSGSRNQAISRFAIASLDSTYVSKFRISKHIQNGRDWFKGQNITGLMCTRWCKCACMFVCVDRARY